MVKEVLDPRNTNPFKVRVSTAHFGINPTHTFINAPDDLVNRFDEIFTEGSDELRFFEKEMSELDAYRVAKLGDQTLTPFAFGRKYLEDLVTGIKKRALPAGQGLNYGIIQGEYSYINQQVATMGNDKACLILQRLVIDAGGRCSTGPAHHIHEIYCDVAKEDKNGGKSLPRTALIALEALRYNTAVYRVTATATRSTEGEHGLNIQRLEETLRNMLGNTGDLHRINHALRTNYAYFGLPPYVFDDATLLESPISSFIFSYFTLANLLKRGYDPDSIIIYLTTELTPFRADLYQWASENNAIKDYVTTLQDNTSGEYNDYATRVGQIKLNNIVKLLLLDLGILVPENASLDMNDWIIKPFDDLHT